jgi:hypothetical protein
MGRVSEGARSALECGSEAERSCRFPLGKNKAVAVRRLTDRMVRRLTDTALQGASRILTAVGDLGSCFCSNDLRRTAQMLRYAPRKSRHSRESGNPPAWAPAYAGATRVGIFIPSGGP